jgi:hypothetical protein
MRGRGEYPTRLNMTSAAQRAIVPMMGTFVPRSGTTRKLVPAVFREAAPRTDWGT